MRDVFGIRRGFCTILAAGALFAAPCKSTAQGHDSSVYIDVSEPATPPQPLPFPVGGRSPGGEVLSANRRYLMKDGAPWFPVMGEFHFSRYPESGWEEEILKMKAGGIQIVSTYIFWIHHEEVEGEFDWAGQRDLRRFVELCAKHGMYVWIRIGPWSHGEVRNGGLPDWLIQKCPTRQSDSVYLRFVQRFYGQIGRQTAGLFWKDGGPIVGVQIENEYHERGPGKGPEHMLALLQLARETGIDAPFYTATAWDTAEIPSRDFLPVFGGYADQFWSRSVEELPPNANYFFTPIRCEENVGDDLQSKRPDIDARLAGYPFLTAEMGGGMELSYHRRPLIAADDVAAMTLVKLGSGVTLYGYYMFHGGTNPDGKLTTLQESQATGYPNDLPVKSYDFQAPLGEFGQMNRSFQNLKCLHLFLANFGSSLAPMSSYFPTRMPTGKTDTSTPRVAARFAGEHGFIFINNYQRSYPLPARKNLQVHLKTPSGETAVPRHPTEIPSGAYLIWPVNLDLGGPLLEYSTAQLLCRLEELNTYVFFNWPGLPAEFAFRSTEDEIIEAPHARVHREAGHVYVDQLEAGNDAAIRILRPGHQLMRIVLLSRDSALNTWKTRLAGHERLVLSSAGLFFTPNAVHITSIEPNQLKFGVLPKLGSTPPGFTTSSPNGIFTQYQTRLKQQKFTARIEKLREASVQPPIRIGQEVAEAPEARAFDGAAEWNIHIPAITSESVQRIYLRITYVGDIARVYADGKLVTDDFFKGTPLQIVLRREAGLEADPTLKLQILPIRKDAPIYLPARSSILFPASGQIAELKGVEIIPEYQAVAALAH